jgi:hypothetical protein
LNNARQDIEGIKAAAAKAPEIYANPASIAEELNIPAGKGRLNIVAFAGLSPVKEEKIEDIDLSIFPLISSLRQYDNEKLRLTKGNLALPVLQPRPSSISSVEVAVNGGTPVKLELLEDMSAAIEATFAAKYHTIFLKTWIRAVVKYVATEVAGQVAKAKAANVPPMLIQAAVTGSKKGLDVSEKADIRGARYFPAKAYVGGITLDPGEYDITVKFNGGDPVTKHVTVKAGGLNIVEAVSLK